MREMNKFNENPLFSFVDALVNGSSNFASEGKIVELFDTGCDARAPCADLKITKESDAIIQSNGFVQSNIPSIRKALNHSLRQDQIPVKKNTGAARHEDKKQSITRTYKSTKQNKVMTWNAKNETATESNETQVKTELDKVSNENDAKSLEHSQQDELTISVDEQKSKRCSTRTCIHGKYSERYKKVKSQSIPKQQKISEGRSSISGTFGERSKTSPTRSMTNPRMTSLIKMSKVTSEASLNHGAKKFVNRAVEKDSLSNCSRQLEIAKTSESLTYSKIVYASRLPRSAGAAKVLTKKNPNLESPAPIGNRKEDINTEALSKIVGGTDHEFQHKDFQGETMKTRSTTGPDKGPAELSTTTRGLNNRNTMTLTSSRSKVAPSKVPISRFSRNSLTGDKTVRRPGNSGEMGVSQASDAFENEKSKSNEKLLSKIEKIHTARDDDLNESSAVERPAMIPEKVTARTSQKCHNLIARETEANNTTIYFQSNLPKPRSSSIVPKLMNEFRLQQQKDTEVSVSPQQSLTVPSMSSKVEMENKKLRARVDEKPQQISISQARVSLLSGVTDATRISNQNSDHVEKRTSNGDVKSVSLSGAKSVMENDEEIELKTIFEDTTSITTPNAKTKSFKNVSKDGQTTTKFRQPSPGPLPNESKVPRPAITKEIPEKAMVRNSSAKPWLKKKESLVSRGASKNSAKTEATTGAKVSMPTVKKSFENVPESKDTPEAIVATNSKEDENEDVIPIMNPALYNVHSIATNYRKRGNLDRTMPEKTMLGGKIESWIDGHEQAYLKGRAIGLKVASMARAAKENLKREYIRSGLGSTTPISSPDKSKEIIDIGLSVIEKVLAEKDDRIYSHSVRGDRASNYRDFEKTIRWSSGEWFT